MHDRGMRKNVAAISLVAITILSMMMLTVSVHAATEEEIEAAILAGLVWLAGEQDPIDGHWGYWPVAETAFAVLKFETYAIETNQLNDEGKIVEIMVEGTDYYPNVEAGLEYLFTNAGILDLTDPDGNGDGLAVYFGNGGNYDTSIAMMAVAASTHPEKTATINAVEMTYEQILQDALDYLVWGQNDGADAGDMRGGWGYGPNTPSWSDQSNTGYVVLALAYAQSSAPYGFGLDIPQITKDELSIWIDTVQCDDGGSKYSPGWDFVDPCYWENTLKTGNLLFEMALVGDTKDTPRVQDALGYIQNHWYDTNIITGWGWNNPTGPAVAQYQAAYCLMKGLETLNIGLDEIPGIANWYQDLADVIVPQQTVDGYWPESPCYVWPEGTYGPIADTVLSTEWALLTLERAAPPVRKLIATGCGRMFAKEEEKYVRGPAELYMIGETAFELVITYKDEEYSRTWEIVDHYFMYDFEVFECYDEYGAFLKVKINHQLGSVQAHGIGARFTGRLVDM